MEPFFCHACYAQDGKAVGDVCGLQLETGRTCPGKYGPPLTRSHAVAVALVESRLYRDGKGYVWEHYDRGRVVRSRRLEHQEAKAACDAWQEQRAERLMGGEAK